MEAVVILSVVVAPFVLLGLLGFRAARQNRLHRPPDDLRRADDASSELPTANQVRERISEIFGRSAGQP